MWIKHRSFKELPLDPEDEPILEVEIEIIHPETGRGIKRATVEAFAPDDILSVSYQSRSGKWYYKTADDCPDWMRESIAGAIREYLERKRDYYEY